MEGPGGVLLDWMMSSSACNEGRQLPVQARHVTWNTAGSEREGSASGKQFVLWGSGCPDFAGTGQARELTLRLKHKDRFSRESEPFGLSDHEYTRAQRYFQSDKKFVNEAHSKFHN